MKKSIPVVIAAVSMSLTLAGTVGAGGNPQHGGEIIYTKPVKSVEFSHKTHVDKKGLTCDMCHAGTFEMQALKAQENPDFNMESLYQGKYCGTCHNGTMAFAANTRCASCHSGVKGSKIAQSH
ncbi:MAG TPA: cytochrome c3 family protein [Geobacteraceae bacterium]|jgi:c(7)-type cytochrome triheme protein